MINRTDRQTKQHNVRWSLLKRRKRMMLNVARQSVQSRITAFNVQRINRSLRQMNARILGF